MATVRLRAVKKAYEKNKLVINNFDLDIHDGEFIVLVGPSGCGKSTILRMIAGLEKITAGEIFIDGKLVNKLPPKDRDIAMVFQNYALYPHMNVYNNLAFSLKLRKYSSHEINERVKRAANILEIGQYLEKKPKELSGGERQRVALGRAIVRNPKVFLFDEPLSNLDAKLRVQMRAEIKRLHRQSHTTMIYVTHDQVEAMTMGDRIVILKDGVIRQVGSPQDVYRRPANKFVGSFIGSPAMNFIYGTIQNGKFTAPGINIDLDLKGRLADGLKVSLGIRPEDITINRGNIEATVVIIEPLGSETIIHVQIGEASILVKHQSLTTLQTGDKITVKFKSEKIVLFDNTTDDPVNI